MLKKLVWIFLGLLLARACVFAWNSAGHMTIAAEAYRQLSPELKRKVTEILKAHPDYGKWGSIFNRGTTGIELAAFVFMHASTWPDEIRRHHNPYDHPQWHYIDYLSQHSQQHT
jgi:hypothetical protein